MVEPTGKLKTILEAIEEAGVPGLLDRTLDHLQGGTSAEWMAQALTEAGFPIGATTIKTYRRKLRAAESERSVKL